jgi:cytochrome c oxidase assembly protein subunit 23
MADSSKPEFSSRHGVDKPVSARGEGQVAPKPKPMQKSVKYDAGGCDELGQASIKCLEKFGVGAPECQEHFDNYKECKKRQTEARRRQFGEQPSIWKPSTW